MLGQADQAPPLDSKPEASPPGTCFFQLLIPGTYRGLLKKNVLKVSKVQLETFSMKRL